MTVPIDKEKTKKSLMCIFENFDREVSHLYFTMKLFQYIIREEKKKLLFYELSHETLQLLSYKMDMENFMLQEKEERTQLHEEKINFLAILKDILEKLRNDIEKFKKDYQKQWNANYANLRCQVLIKILNCLNDYKEAEMLENKMQIILMKYKNTGNKYVMPIKDVVSLLNSESVQVPANQDLQKYY